MPNKRKGIEYPSKSGIIICPKTNPSGNVVFRVDIPASLTGQKREQRQLPSKSEAKQYADRRYQEIRRFGHSAFNLTSRQREDATRAIEILKAHNVTLEAVAQRYVQQSPINRSPITVGELRALFLAAPGKRKKKVLVRRLNTLRGLKWRTAQFASKFGSQLASEIKTEDIQSWLKTLGGQSPVSLNNHRRALHAMFSMAASENYCNQNPVSKIPLYVVPDKAPPILTVAEASRLINKAADTESSLGLLGYICLGLFAGLRRVEIERLDWSAVKWERRMITVDGSIAKTGSIRNVALSSNAYQWLQRCFLERGPIVPPNLNPKLKRLRQLAGIAQWETNVLRHSFASYHFDCHQNAPLTAAQLGHTSGCQLLFEHYRSLVPLGDGQRYFDILPKAEPSAVQLG